MKNILWVCDLPNWAYDINAKALSTNLPQYNHYFIYTGEQGREAVDKVIFDMDIIVAMNPLGFYMYSKFDKVVAILDSVRAVEDSKQDVFSKVVGIICTNNFLFEFAKTKNKKVILQPNGVDLDIYCPSFFQSNNRKFTVGFAANIKGHYADYKGWLFYQEAVNSLSDKIEQLNVIYGVSQIPSDKMVPEFYHKIDCLILPSKNEGCSNVIAEALACGVPVICTKVGYHGHSLQNYNQCIYVERNSESIRTAILQMCENPVLYMYMREEARKFACQNHNIRTVAQNYVNFFEGVMQK